MKILFLSRWFPYPSDNGARLRISHLLHGLAQQHEVHLLSFRDRDAPDTGAVLNAGCKSVRTVMWKEFDPSSSGVMGLLGTKPRSLVETYSVEMEQEIRAALEKQRFDLVILSQWQMSAYQDCFADLPILIEEIEVGILSDECAFGAIFRTRMRACLTWFKHSRYLAQLLNNQPCTVVSEKEKKLLTAFVPNALIEVIPNGVNLAAYEQIMGEPEPDSLIFTGSFRYRPNYDAMVWFLEQVFPLIRAQIPGARLTITGDHAGLPLPSLEGVTLTGFVDDVRPLVKRSWGSIVPLKTGGGTRLKILEAMALHAPVVSTTKGAEGLAVADGVHLEIADTAEDFANRTILLLKDRALRERLAANAFKLMGETYDWKEIMPRFLEVVESAASRSHLAR